MSDDLKEVLIGLLIISVVTILTVICCIPLVVLLRDKNNSSYKYFDRNGGGVSGDCDRESMTCKDSEGFVIKVDKFREIKK